MDKKAMCSKKRPIIEMGFLIMLILLQTGCLPVIRENLGNLESPQERSTAPPRVRVNISGNTEDLNNRCLHTFYSSNLFSNVSTSLKRPQIEVNVNSYSNFAVGFLRPSSTGPLGPLTLFIIPTKSRLQRAKLDLEIVIPLYSKVEKRSIRQTVDLWWWLPFLPFSFSQKSPEDVYDRLCDALPLHVHRVYESFLGEAWSRTQNTADIKSYERFLDTYPDTKFSKVASSWLEKRLWKSASVEGNARSYLHYLERFPQGKFAKQARSQGDDAVWNKLKRSVAPEKADMERYLAAFPSGKYSTEAVARLKNIGAVLDKGKNVMKE